MSDSKPDDLNQKRSALIKNIELSASLEPSPEQAQADVPMPSTEEYRNRILKAIDAAIEEGDWDGTLFLRNILKRLKALHDYVDKELGDHPIQESPQTSLNDTQAETEKEGYQKVYISLYQGNASQLERWFVSIKMLVGYAINRPIYGSLEDVERMVREKKSTSDAYVVAWIKQTDIIPLEKPIQDRWGSNLLAIRESSVQLENVIEFVHVGIHYKLTPHGLVLQ